MKPSRLEGKVGLFVFIGLVLLAALLLQFSKGTTFFRRTYDILLSAPTAGGLKARAQVLMSGIQVGNVAELQLGPTGTNVVITLQIFQPYKIFKDARFAIEQSGFLGDQYIAILPTRNQGELFRPGDEATVEPPLDVQEVARKLTGLIGDIGSLATNINIAIKNAERTALSAESLANLTTTFSNFSRLSDRSLNIAEAVNSLVESNRPALTVAVSNLSAFLDQANQVASRVDGLLATNSPEIGAALQDLRSSSASLKRLLARAEQGRGLAGNMLENEEMAANVSQIFSNLSITTSNLNRLGLWGILWKRKVPATNAPALVEGPLTAPKDPFQ